MGKKKQAVAYIRVSTSGQAESGAGLNLQRISIDAYAEAAGLTVVETFSDAQSGVGADSATARSGLKAAILKSRELNCPILIDGLDRLSRDTTALEKFLSDKGLKIISTRHGENPQHAVMIAAAERAQAEAERISRTTKKGLEKARARGTQLGNRTNLEEARLLGIATNQRKAGELTRKLMPIIKTVCTDRKLTKAQIADELNRLGYRTPRGKPWSDVTIRPQLERIAGWERASEASSDNPLFGMF
jgi:DNA invertase Pin-like site-specific DNA recombinase